MGTQISRINNKNKTNFNYSKRNEAKVNDFSNINKFYNDNQLHLNFNFKNRDFDNK